MCALNECHIAGHVFWHLSQRHPSAASCKHEVTGDYLREVLEAIDHGIGEIVDAAPAGSTVVVFSHGMQANNLDLNSMLFLPELLQRWNSGRAALAEGDISGPVPPPRTDYRRHWREELWDLVTPYGRTALESPLVQAGRGSAGLVAGTLVSPALAGNARFRVARLFRWADPYQRCGA